MDEATRGVALAWTSAESPVVGGDRGIGYELQELTEGVALQIGGGF